MKCSECHKKMPDVVDMLAYQYWIKVMNYIEMEYLQGDITLEAHDELTNCLYSLKVLVDDADERSEKEWNKSYEEKKDD